MLLIPAIDLKEGQCVRLRQGDFNQTTIFSDNPVEQAQKWVDAAARRLHLVDLDGACEGKPKNLEIIENIVKALPDIPVQVGGGIREFATIEHYLSIGIKYVIIGTKAVQDPDFVRQACQKYPHHIIVGLDAKHDKLALDGWLNVSEVTIIDFAKKLADFGVEAIVYTDIQRDGMMQGYNKQSTLDLAQAINIPVIASGGISDMTDIEALCNMEQAGVMGAIIGRALYEGSIDLTKAQALADKLSGS